jgi:hypothetical protein
MRGGLSELADELAMLSKLLRRVPLLMPQSTVLANEDLSGGRMAPQIRTAAWSKTRPMPRGTSVCLMRNETAKLSAEPAGGDLPALIGYSGFGQPMMMLS